MKKKLRLDFAYVAIENRDSFSGLNLLFRSHLTSFHILNKFFCSEKFRMNGSLMIMLH